MTAAKKWVSAVEQINNTKDITLSESVELIDLKNVTTGGIYDKKIAICRDTPPEKNLAKTLETNIKHIVQINALEFKKEVATSDLMIVDPNKFFENPSAAILDPVNFAKNCQKIEPIFNYKFTNLSEKGKIINRIETVLLKFCKSKSFIYDVQLVSDELITNAIFHATEDIDTRKDYMTVPNQGEIFIAKDKNRIVVGCKDTHGKLNPKKLFTRLHLCYTSEIAEKINMGKGGAGIGSFLIYNVSSSYYVAVCENVQTIVCSLIPLQMGNRKRQKLPKNLHYIYFEENQNE